MSPTHLAIFMPELNIGGAQKVAVRLANGFVEAGYRVDFVVCHRQGPLFFELQAAVNVVDLGCRRVAKAVLPLVKYLRGARPAFFMSHLSYVNFAAVVAVKLAAVGTKLLVVEHTDPLFEAAAFSPRHRFSAKFLRRWLYPRADAVVAVSQQSAASLQTILGRSRLTVDTVYNPVFDQTLERQAQAGADHPWLQRQDPLVLAVGRLSREKDFAMLIAAFAKVRSHLATARLIILGEGPERGALESLIFKLGVREAVSMPGFVSNPYAFMSAAAVLALSSRYEGFSLVLAEALACGCPVVATNCQSGPAEVLSGGTFGKLVPVGDAEAMSQALLVTIANPLAPAVLKSRGAEFSSAKSVAAYGAIMERIQ